MDNQQDQEHLTSPFDLAHQQDEIENKIVAGLERISESFRVLLWDKAKAYGLSPMQLQIMIFLKYHPPAKSTVSYLAREFNVKLPTISDAVKTLENKGMIERTRNASDTRSSIIRLTSVGAEISENVEDFANPVKQAVFTLPSSEKEDLWQSLSEIIFKLNQAGSLTVQRMCFNCKYYETEEGPFCKLLDKPLSPADIRLDCPEFIDATNLPKQM